MPAQHRECCRCHETKSIDDFYNHNRYKDGKFRFCKACAIKESNERASEWRKKAIDRLGGPHCVYCGCEIYELLQINHIDGDGKLDRKQNGMVSGKFWRHIALNLRDVSGLEVACYLCNQRHYVEHILGYKGFRIIYTPRISKN